jgi:esterase/lipase superfamily enzyme
MTWIQALRSAVAAVIVAMAGVTSVSSAPYIEKIEGRALSGTAYARLTGLTYKQCETRCLGDQRCVALEHMPAKDDPPQLARCSLFSATRTARADADAVIGYKRGVVAARPQSPGSSGVTDGERKAREDARRAEFDSARRDAERRQQQEERQSASAERAARANAEAQRREAERLAALRRQELTARQRATAEAQRGEAEPEAAPPRPRTGATRSITPVNPPVAAAPAPAPTTRGISPPIVGSGAPADAAKATENNDKFHIVPVYYGTDRNRVDGRPRFNYANDRARRLELGQALVSVPLIHKVPNIERPRAWTVPYLGTIQFEKEDPAKHFTVRQIRTLSKAELLTLVKERLRASSTFRNQAIVFVHGYNTSFDDALFRTAQITFDLQFDGASFTYSWPSAGGVAGYVYDMNSAKQAEPYLYQFLEMVQNETGATSINIIAHSMGNQMLLEVLRTLKLRAPAVSKINQIILASPDVDRDAFENMAREISGVAKGITLYAAANDQALKASRIVAGNKPRAGDVPPEGPIIVPGVDTIDISALSTSYLALHHSGYAEHTDLLTDIAHLLKRGTRPWSERLKAYSERRLPTGTYWVYTKR